MELQLWLLAFIEHIGLSIVFNCNFPNTSLGMLILKKSAMEIKSFLWQQLYTSEVGCKRESNVNKSKSNSISQALTSPPTSKIAKRLRQNIQREKNNMYHLQIWLSNNGADYILVQRTKTDEAHFVTDKQAPKFCYAPIIV